jgi:hypothetical protein
MEGSLAAIKITNTASKLTEKCTKEEYNKLIKAPGAINFDFTQQGQIKRGKSLELT